MNEFWKQLSSFWIYGNAIIVLRSQLFDDSIRKRKVFRSWMFFEMLDQRYKMVFLIEISVPLYFIGSLESSISMGEKI
jgi:hypothetical protein